MQTLSQVGLKENLSKKRRKMETSVKVKELEWCHQCGDQKEGELVVECTKCESNNYCSDCITTWYTGVSKEEFVKACPVCCNKCSCKACLRKKSPKDMEGNSCSETDKIKYSRQILQKVYPLVKRMYEDHLEEKEIEDKVKGVSTSESHLRDADIFCDGCGSYFLNLYRTCPCGYVLCLVCCRELRDGQVKGTTCEWKTYIDGSIPCPSKDIGGCDDGTLELKCLICDDWIVSLLEKAQRMYKINYRDDNPKTSIDPSVNHLYSLSAKDIQPQHMQHFQFHWSKGEPVIVNDVFSTSAGLSWQSKARSFPDLGKNSHSAAYDVQAINCLDWSEVTINLSDFFTGYAVDQFKQPGPLILKLEDWQPSCLSQEEDPRLFVELFDCLPFQDYTNPDNGYLNVAVKLPDISLKPELGPKMDIAYGVEEELGYGDSVTKLHYEKSDTVNVMTHTKSNVLASAKLNKTKRVKQEQGDEQYVVDEMKGGALWDIFQRQDVPKLEEYLRNHSTEFRHTGRLPVEQVIHPIHDRTFYLNTEHKRKLKQEFGIEPWSFKQKLGDAIFIPAGCPYQVRNLKSSTKVELNFISPESLGECLRLQNELRVLPNKHRAKQQKLNIGKIVIHALEHAVAELSGFVDSDGPCDGLQNELDKVHETLDGGDAMDIQSPISNWKRDSKSDASQNHTVEDKPALHALDHAVTELSGFVDSDGPCDGLQDELDKVHGALDVAAGDAMDVNSPINDWERDSKSDDIQDHTVEDTPTHIEVTLTSEVVGLWQGHDVGPAAKEMLNAVKHHYPDTFTLQIRSKPYWRAILEGLHLFIKRFLETSVGALEEDQVSSLEVELNDFERFGFHLSWVRNRLEMVKNLKMLHEELKMLHEELVEANKRLEKARFDYDRAIDARNNKAYEIAHMFGAAHNLGFGLVPGH